MSAHSQSLWQPPAIAPVDPQIAAGIRAVIDGKAKPPGSLGRIEDLALQLGMIRHPGEPRGDNAVLLIFAGDHGLVAEGVSQYPSAVTVAMVTTYLAGRATANAFAAANDIGVRVIDIGVAAELPVHPKLVDAKVRMGTANAAREPAMTAEHAADALTRGFRIAVGEIKAGADIIALGEMGIGNTASSALVVHRLAPAPLDDCIGVGAGQDDAGSDATAPLDVLAEFGGLEIAGMAGAILGAASQRRPVIIDGFISSAAALLAVRLSPAARDYCVFAHRSAERGHDMVLDALDAQPLLDLGLRLGEGTGALLAVPLVRAAARMLTDVASLNDVLAGNI
jgi:nicotinate-nucleotide--dimethylbenzimidazole phosphoribosyltransferase